MRGQPERVGDSDISAVVADGWELGLDELSYFPEGAGAYHWVAYKDGARRWFVTCDDLETKPWLGSKPDAVFDGLLAAYGTATDLRRLGLTFVAAPIPSKSGAPAQRVDERHSVSVFEYIRGEPGQWGGPVAATLHDELVAMLAELHRAPPGRSLDRRPLEVPARTRLEEALDEIDVPWAGGPLSEPARRELARNADRIIGWLDDFDRFAASLHDPGDNMVITHGEPHPGNVIHTSAGLALVDWDTVALARPERDLWMLVEQGDPGLSSYTRLTGVALDRDALLAYRLLWALSDIAAFTVHLREEHRQHPDAERALAGLVSILAGREPAPYGTRSM